MITKRLTVNFEEAGERIDSFLSRTPGITSRSMAQRLIKEERVLVNGSLVKPSYHLLTSDRIEVTFEAPEALIVEAQAIPLDIIYEDGDLIVLNKPRGLVVHPAAGNRDGTLVNALLAHCQELSTVSGEFRPGIVHRLDKDTSGLLVAAKNNPTHLHLAKQLKARTVIRKYLALVHGTLSRQTGTISAPIGRHRAHRKKMAVIPGGRVAVTHYRVIEELDSLTLLEVTLETGRTHQIRVHLNHIGHPVVGDPVYGRRKKATSISGQALHAFLLGFIHPGKSEYMEFSSPMPSDMEEIINLYRRK